MYLQAIPQGPSLLELREQGQEDNDIGYRKEKKKKKKKSPHKGLICPGKHVLIAI